MIARGSSTRLAQQEFLSPLNARLEERVEGGRELREKNQQIREQLQMARELQIAPTNKFPTVPRTHRASALRFLSLFSLAMLAAASF